MDETEADRLLGIIDQLTVVEGESPPAGEAETDESDADDEDAEDAEEDEESSSEAESADEPGEDED